MLTSFPSARQAAPQPRRAGVFPRAVRADEILRGLARGEFHAVFQPWVDTRTGAVVLLEATLRWRHPACGLLAPCDFLCEADQHNLLEHVALALVAQTADDAAHPWPVPVVASLSGAVLRGSRIRLDADALPRRIDLADCDDTRAALTRRLKLVGAGLALSGVDTLLRWYVAAESGAPLVQGDFICAPTPRRELAAALRRWQATFDAINACADYVPLSSSH